MSKYITDTVFFWIARSNEAIGGVTGASLLVDDERMEKWKIGKGDESELLSMASLIAASSFEKDKVIATLEEIKSGYVANGKERILSESNEFNDCFEKIIQNFSVSKKIKFKSQGKIFRKDFSRGTTSKTSFGKKSSGAFVLEALAFSVSYFGYDTVFNAVIGGFDLIERMAENEL